MPGHFKLVHPCHEYGDPEHPAKGLFGGLLSLGSGDNEINMPAAATGAGKASMPVR
jgi:hypothetical protein